MWSRQYMSLHAADPITNTELREAFRRSGLWRDGWTFQRAIENNCVYLAMRATVRAIRAKEEQQHGKPAPMQRALI